MLQCLRRAELGTYDAHFPVNHLRSLSRWERLANLLLLFWFFHDHENRPTQYSMLVSDA